MMPAISTILHPTDFSDISQYAFQMACSLAKDYEARLIVLHVIFQVPTAATRESMEERLPWPRTPEPKIDVDFQVAEGDAADEILHLAKTVACDLIVMGTHGRTGLERVLTGSVAEQVLRKAPCPVLAVRTPLPQTPSAERIGPAGPGDVIDIRPVASDAGSVQSKTLVRGKEVEVIRLSVPAGKKLEGKAKREFVIECLEGQVAFTAFGKTQILHAGNLLCLPAGTSYSVKGIQSGLILLTTFSDEH
jgi:nucleotide-binding universal stress UspA family protein/quercetin dioxygenase-like cupin family protein